MANDRFVAVNDSGNRIGEDHGRAKLSDYDVELIVSLLDAREVLITEYLKVGLSRGKIEKCLSKAQLSYAGIAAKFECSKSEVFRISRCVLRRQTPARWKKVACT